MAAAAANISRAAPPTATIATHGVFQRRCTVPSATGRVRSRPIAKSERVTWRRVVSRVATVDRRTAQTRILPPMPGQTSWPMTARTLGPAVRISSAVSRTLTTTVTATKRRKTKATPTSAASPAVRRLFRVSSLRLLVTSQPQ